MDASLRDSSGVTSRKLTEKDLLGLGIGEHECSEDGTKWTYVKDRTFTSIFSPVILSHQLRRFCGFSHRSAAPIGIQLKTSKNAKLPPIHAFLLTYSKLPKLRTWVRFPSPAPVTFGPIRTQGQQNVPATKLTISDRIGFRVAQALAYPDRNILNHNS